MKNAFADLEAAFPSAWERLPFWASYRRIKRMATGTEELLSVYRDYGVIRKSDRDDNFNKASDDLTTYQLVRPGDLVINKMKAWQGSVAVSQLSGIVSPAYFVFSPVHANVPQFMHYLLRSAPYIEAYRAGSKGIRPNQWDLDPDMLRTFPMPTPSIELQQQTAEFLDRETAEIDAFIADQEELIGLLAERRDAIHASHFQDVVHAGFISVGRPFGEVCTESDFRVGLNERGLMSVSIHRGLVPWSEMHDKDPRSDSFAQYKSVGPGNVVLNRMRAFQGAAGVASEPGMVSPDYAVLVVTPPNIPAYVGEMLRSAPMLEAIKLRLRGIGDTDSGAVRTPRVNVRDLMRIRVDMPDCGNQERAIGSLQRETAELDAVLADARDAIALSRERRAALISAAVTGKIDVREAV